MKKFVLSVLPLEESLGVSEDLFLLFKVMGCKSDRLAVVFVVEPFEDNTLEELVVK